MKIKVISILIILALILTGCGVDKDAAAVLSAENEDAATMPIATWTPAVSLATEEPAKTPGATELAPSEEDSETPYEREAKRDLLALMMAYPDEITDVQKGADGLLYVVMRTGSKIVYDDMKHKNFDELLASADLQDMMALDYPLEDIDLLMEDDFDPGRFRNYELLMAVYGEKQDAIEANLESVMLGTQMSPFNIENGAGEALAQVFLQLADIISSDSTISEFVYPMSGTYNYRVIAGTDRLSPHAFAIAIDLKNVSTDYWREATKSQGQARLDVFPKEIVKAFEENGFIWGGKWAHFDLLHFEYRPELIAKSKYYMEQEEGALWYQGYPVTDETLAFIEIVDAAFDGS